MHAIIEIHALAPDKPAEGAACNGCGVCCLAAPCPVSSVFLAHRHGACPALVWQDDSHHYRCGMLQAPSQFNKWIPKLLDRPMRHFVKRWLAIGIGCDCDVNML